MVPGTNPTKLAASRSKVISRQRPRNKGKPADLRRVSQQLRVANILEGTVQKASDKVRINVQLIDARTDSHLWAKTYDRDLADVFAIQSEVAQEIADALKAKLSPAEANTVASAPTKDTQAYDLFLKGEFEQVSRHNFRPEAFDQATRLYRRQFPRSNFASPSRNLLLPAAAALSTDPLPEADLMATFRWPRGATLAPIWPKRWRAWSFH